MKFIRDVDGDLWIEVPGEPGRFAQAEEFSKGKKYVEMWALPYSEVEEYGPLTVEWETSES